MPFNRNLSICVVLSTYEKARKEEGWCRIPLAFKCQPWLPEEVFMCLNSPCESRSLMFNVAVTDC